MDDVGIRALKQNASAVVASVAEGRSVTITDRGRPVAQLSPLISGELNRLLVSGRLRAPRRSLRDLSVPAPGELTPHCEISAATSATDVAYYLDTSALVKLVVAEAESAALNEWLTSCESELVTCDLARTGLMRAVRRVSPDRAVRAREVLESVFSLSLSTATYDAAARLQPSELRSLDAVHLAAALELGADLEGIIVYDDRLADAAGSYGITTIAPA